MRIALLNDLHPDDSPGAASIALSLATSISPHVDRTEFWCGSENPQSLTRGSSNSVKLSVYASTQRSSSRFRGKISEFFEMNSLCWIIRNSERFKPDVIWIHQIGNVFPRFLLLYLKLRRVQSYCTIHDFTLIVPRKLYPSDFHLFSSDEDGITLGKFDPFEKGYARVYLRVRLVLNRFLYNHFSKIICISEMQASIYRHFGFNVFDVIQNGVDECHVDHNAVEVGDEKINLLFVGRMVGKGLHYALTVTALNPQLHLLLVGGNELLDEATKSLDDSRFTYIGRLSSFELIDVYHRADYLVAISECFDVFPGVVLEALSHGCKVFTSDSVGNSYFGIKESFTTIIESQDDFQTVTFQKVKKSMVLTFPKHSDVAERYLRVFQNGD